MDTLHRVMRALQPDRKAGDGVKSEAAREPITVFREFLAHLDRVTRNPPPKPRAKTIPRKPVKRRTKR